MATARKLNIDMPEFNDVLDTDTDGEGVAQMRISVDKGGRGGIGVYVNVGWHRTDELRFDVFSFAMFGDYSGIVATIPCKRVTQKAIDAAYDGATTEAMIDEYKAKARAHYAATAS